MTPARPYRGFRQGSSDPGLGFSIHCRTCSHIARIRAAVALRLWGERALTLDIADDLRCSKCRTAGAYLSVVAETRALKTPGDYWGPGPDYPELVPPLGLAWRALKSRRGGEG